MIIVLDERLDLGFEVAGQEVVFQQDAVLQGLVPALDLALGLGMIRRSAHMFHSAIVELFGQIAGYVAGAIVAEQSRPLRDGDVIEARRRKRLIERGRDV